MGLRTSRWKRLSKNISKQYCQNIFLLLGAHLLLLHWLGATCEEVSFPAFPTNRGGRWRISFRHRVHEQVLGIVNHQFCNNQSIHQIIDERYYFSRISESFECAYVNKCDQDSQRLSCRAGQRDDARTFPRFVLISTLMETMISREILLPPRVDINYQGSLTWLRCSTRIQPRRRCHHPQDHLLLKSPLPSSTTLPTAWAPAWRAPSRRPLLSSLERLAALLKSTSCLRK